MRQVRGDRQDHACRTQVGAQSELEGHAFGFARHDESHAPRSRLLALSRLLLSPLSHPAPAARTDGAPPAGRRGAVDWRRSVDGGSCTAATACGDVGVPGRLASRGRNQMCEAASATGCGAWRLAPVMLSGSLPILGHKSLQMDMRPPPCSAASCAACYTHARVPPSHPSLAAAPCSQIGRASRPSI